MTDFKWQSMKTAPMDGTLVLLRLDTRLNPDPRSNGAILLDLERVPVIVVGFFSSARDGWLMNFDEYGQWGMSFEGVDTKYVTAWCPIPEYTEPDETKP